MKKKINILVFLIILFISACTRKEEEKQQVFNPDVTISTMESSAEITDSTTKATESSTESIESIITKSFIIKNIDEALKQRIMGKSYKENESISLENLKYLKVLHIGFDGKTHVGELIVNEKIADDVLEIFKELYENEYPIEKMLLVDEYGADDNKSMEDNNTSAFNYRQIAGTTRLSNHALGMAIDINPLYNPYIRSDANGNTIVEPEGAVEYTDRTNQFSYKIDENDLCYKLFIKYGFSWGGDWSTPKDYQHFEKEE